MDKSKTPNPKYKHLLILKLALENNLGFIHSAGGLHSASFHWYNREDGKTHGLKFDWDWFKINSINTTTIHAFHTWGWTTPENKNDPRFIRTRMSNVVNLTRVDEPQEVRESIFAWYDTPYCFKKSAVEYWEATGRALFEELQAEEDEKRRAVERFVIIGATNEALRKKAYRKAGMLVKVIRETEKRCYVEAIDKADSDIGVFQFIQGTAGKTYINKDQIWKDAVSQDFYHRMVKIEDSIVEDKKALKQEMNNAIKEIREQFQKREIQQDAYFNDLYQEAIHSDE